MPLATVANEFLSKIIRYQYGKDITAVCPQGETANILVVSPALGVNSVAELVNAQGRDGSASPEPAKADVAG